MINIATCLFNPPSSVGMRYFQQTGFLWAFFRRSAQETVGSPVACPSSLPTHFPIWVETSIVLYPVMYTVDKYNIYIYLRWLRLPKQQQTMNSLWCYHCCITTLTPTTAARIALGYFLADKTQFTSCLLEHQEQQQCRQIPWYAMFADRNPRTLVLRNDHKKHGQTMFIVSINSKQIMVAEFLSVEN